MEQAFSLKGRVALVTGASQGLGLAMARSMSRAGAHVVLNARDETRLQNVADRLRSEGGLADIAPFDVTDEARSQDAVTRIVEKFGRLDILVANAGMTIRHSALDYPTADWNRLVAVNLTACFTLCRDAGRHMVERKWGRIILMSSILGVRGRSESPAYTATKHGVAGLAKSLAAEFGASGVTVNCIAPGFTRTEMNAEQMSDKALLASTEARIPLGRWAEPEEIAGAAVFLASNAGSYVNGHVLIVDGGMTATL